MKGRHTNLQINAYAARHEQTNPNKGINITCCKYFCPSDATDDERRIHKFLDENKILMVDVK